MLTYLRPTDREHPYWDLARTQPGVPLTLVALADAEGRIPTGPHEAQRMFAFLDREGLGAGLIALEDFDGEPVDLVAAMREHTQRYPT